MRFGLAYRPLDSRAGEQCLTTRSSGPGHASLRRAASALLILRRPRALGRCGRPLNASVSSSGTERNCIAMWIALIIVCAVPILVTSDSGGRLLLVMNRGVFAWLALGGVALVGFLGLKGL